MTIQTEMTQFPCRDIQVPGFLARPTEAGRFPGLVVIQEWWGLVPHIKDVAGRFAAAGFIALAPDLYHGRETSEPDEARKLSMELDRSRAVEEIECAIAHLQTLEQVWPDKIGVVGWCMGGSLTILTAAHSDQIGAAVAFYGLPRDLGLAAALRAPLLGLYGEHDHGIPVEAVRQFEQELREHGAPHEIQIYPGAGHAFFNETRAQAYHPQAAADAWQRTLGWFRRHLITDIT